MKYWVEIHCEATDAMKSAAGLASYGYEANVCEADINNQPGAMASNLSSAARTAKQQAKERGWRTVKGVGFCCKACGGVRP